MKYYFLKHNNESRLLLFFAGWGMDYHVFPELGEFNGDVCICYDYAEMNFNESLFVEYNHIKLVSWSMCVWVASFLLQHKRLKFEKKIAINGTLYPIDYNKGLVPEIYDATLHFLTEKSLLKFYRRMCNGKDLLALFMEHKPQRTLDSVKRELMIIGKTALSSPTPIFNWDKIFIGDKDLIFTTANQKDAWNDQACCNIIPASHYINFNFILRDEEEYK